MTDLNFKKIKNQGMERVAEVLNDIDFYFDRHYYIYNKKKVFYDFIFLIMVLL